MRRAVSKRRDRPSGRAGAGSFPSDKSKPNRNQAANERTDLRDADTVPIYATLTGANRCEALGIIRRGSAPLLALCRALVAAGHDPRRPLHA